MEKTEIAITLSFSRIKSVCEAIMRCPDAVCQPGEKLLADHILKIIKEEFDDG